MSSSRDVGDVFVAGFSVNITSNVNFKPLIIQIYSIPYVSFSSVTKDDARNTVFSAHDRIDVCEISAYAYIALRYIKLSGVVMTVVTRIIKFISLVPVIHKVFCHPVMEQKRLVCSGVVLVTSKDLV